MMLRAVSWCGEELEDHLASTALVARILYGRDWEALRARIQRRLCGSPGGTCGWPPSWLLELAACIHDIGKASPPYQSDARRLCGEGRAPRFYLHEYLSAYAALAVAEKVASALQLGGPERAAAASSLAAAATAAMLHHHGMRGRLTSVGEAQARLERGGYLPVGLDVLRGMIEHTSACCEELPAKGCAWIARVILDSSRELGKAPGFQSLMRGMPGRPWILGSLGSGALSSYQAMASFLAGAVALSDTLAASLCRRGSPGGYAERILRESTRMKGSLEGLASVLPCRR